MEFIKKYLYSKNLRKDLDKSLDLLKKMKEKKNKLLSETLTMTVIEI